MPSDLASPVVTGYGGIYEDPRDPNEKECWKLSELVTKTQEEVLKYIPMNNATLETVERELSVWKLVQEKWQQNVINQGSERNTESRKQIADAILESPETFSQDSVIELISPVVTKYGSVYEEVSLIKWLRSNGTDPNTRQPLRLSEVYKLSDLVTKTQGEILQRIPIKPTTLRSAERDLRVWKLVQEKWQRNLDRKIAPPEWSERTDEKLNELAANILKREDAICLAEVIQLDSPVVTKYGTVYEEQCLRDWLRREETDPLNRQPLDPTNFVKISELVTKSQREVSLELIPFTPTDSYAERDLRVWKLVEMKWRQRNSGGGFMQHQP
jgi:hypothetical protein